MNTNDRVRAELDNYEGSKIGIVIDGTRNHPIKMMLTTW